MAFEWSEAKRLTVLSRRALDFVAVTALFDGRPLFPRLHHVAMRNDG